MERVFNFSAGPAMLPTDALQRAKDELLDWHDCGMSVMEMTHRGKRFGSIVEKIERDFRELLAIPDNYTVLFLHGGSRSQFAMVPMNLLNGASSAAYAITGLWGDLSAQEASRYCNINEVVNTKDSRCTSIPDAPDWQPIHDNDAYLHYVDNETVNGVEFANVPASHGKPLVCDMSSNLLTRPVDINKFGLIYACAQKNLGPAGVTMLIIRNDLLQCKALEFTPSMFRYKEHADKQSMYNTPPTYPWYVSGLVFEWVKEQGGLQEMDKRNRAKSDKLYAFIDGSDFYDNPVRVSARSRVNVPFTIKGGDPDLEAAFVKESEEQHLMNLKGHRFVGGLRASIYNAMPMAGVDALIDFMMDFEKRHG